MGKSPWLPAILTIILAACGDSTGNPRVLVFNGQGNHLDAYEPATGQSQRVIGNRNSDPAGWDINAQICFDPDGSRRFIAGEDTGQPNPPQGWGFFQLEGDAIGELSARRLGKLTPTYQGALDNAENYGCGFLSDGRLVTSDVGDQASGPANGQLIIWFPPFDRDQVPYCKLDVSIGTAGGIWVDKTDRVLVASARVTPGIWAFEGPFPTGPNAAGGCGRRDLTGAPLADLAPHSLFIPADSNIITPNAVISDGDGGYLVSSVLNGVIARYDEGGAFVERILEAPANETLGPVPYTTGTPMGLGRDSTGNVYYADIGIVLKPSGSIGPGRNVGTVRMLPLENGEFLAPVTLATGLAYPDGIGVLELR